MKTIEKNKYCYIFKHQILYSAGDWQRVLSGTKDSKIAVRNNWNYGLVYVKVQ